MIEPSRKAGVPVLRPPPGGRSPGTRLAERRRGGPHHTSSAEPVASTPNCGHSPAAPSAGAFNQSSSTSRESARRGGCATAWLFASLQPTAVRACLSTITSPSSAPHDIFSATCPRATRAVSDLAVQVGGRTAAVLGESLSSFRHPREAGANWCRFPALKRRDGPHPARIRSNSLVQLTDRKLLPSSCDPGVFQFRLKPPLSIPARRGSETALPIARWTLSRPRRPHLDEHRRTGADHAPAGRDSTRTRRPQRPHRAALRTGIAGRPCRD